MTTDEPLTEMLKQRGVECFELLNRTPSIFTAGK